MPLVRLPRRDRGRGAATASPRDSEPLQLPDRCDREGGRPAAALEVVTDHRDPVNERPHAIDPGAISSVGSIGYGAPEPAHPLPSRPPGLIR